jgi:hypothetical protein
MVNAQWIEPVYGIESTFLLSGSSNYGWELFAAYLLVGLQTKIFRMSVFGGGGLSAAPKSSISEWIDNGYSEIDFTWTCGFGGSLEVLLNWWEIGIGYGMAGPNRGDKGKHLYPFIRGSIGFGMFEAAKFYYDYNFENNGWKLGLLVRIDLREPSYTPYPSPSPRPVDPYPQPAPYIPPEEPPVEENNEGTIYYQYDGIGYVYVSESIFYLCSSGRPVGYIERGVIYSFGGAVLGFYEKSFIYDRNGNPVGAANPKSLGTDATGKKPVTKAAKQDVPVKQPQASVNKPRLKNGYFGGSLRDVF